MFRSIPRLSEKDIERFWSHVDRKGQNDCWKWNGSTNGDGYGHIRVKHGIYQTHRVAYLIEHHSIEDTLETLHSCDNPPCCNPRHLFQGTHFDNMRDCSRKSRNGSQTHPERLARGDKHGLRLHPDRVPRGDNHWLRKAVGTVRDTLTGRFVKRI